MNRAGVNTQQAGDFADEAARGVDELPGQRLRCVGIMRLHTPVGGVEHLAEGCAFVGVASLVEKAQDVLGVERAAWWGWPNIYTYTKSLGEQLVAAEEVESDLVLDATQAVN